MEFKGQVPSSREVGRIPCCLCGTMIQPNGANMCVPCLKSKVDVTEGINRQQVVNMCKTCGAWRAGASGKWVRCELESAELLAVCLKGVSLKGTNFVDAKWIWTEPHSRRLKIRVTVEKEVMNNTTVRQNFVLESIVKTRLCDQCVKETTDQNWTTIVQIRQHVDHQRTLLNLENKLVRNGAAKSALQIVQTKTGLDVYFKNKPSAIKFADHVVSSIPCKRSESKKLMGTDTKSNKSNYRHSIVIEVVPICKHDFIVLPHKLQHALFGGKNGALLVEGISRTVNLVNPETMDRAKLSEKQFWPNSFRALARAREMILFDVLDVQPLDYAAVNAAKAAAAAAAAKKKKENEQEEQDEEDDEEDEDEDEDLDILSQEMLVEVEVARQRDLGVNDERFLVTSHLWRLEPGDTVLGYDFANHNYGDDVLKPLKGRGLPTIVLVQRVQDKPIKKKKTNQLKKPTAKTLVQEQEVLSKEDSNSEQAQDSTVPDQDVSNPQIIEDKS